MLQFIKFQQKELILKKIITTSLIGILTTLSLNAEDCIIAKDLNVQFKNDSTIYQTSFEYDKVKEYAEFLKETDLYAIIEGHTNNSATARHNYELSKNRAAKLKQDLINLGVDSSKLQSLGYGESKPKFDNSTNEGMEKNRRVISDVFNTMEELNNYYVNAKSYIDKNKFIEQ